MIAASDPASLLRAERTAGILADLVRIPSRNPEDGEAGVAEYVAAFTRELGLVVDVREVLGGRPNVVARLNGRGGGPTLVLNTHMDTVPEAGGWTRDPFGAEIAEGRLYGRGAVDAKGPLAAFLAALEAIVRSGVALTGDLVLAAVVDEETSSTGARELVRDLRADFAIVGEPTALRVGIAHRGSLRPVIAVTGRTAHSSRPAEGVNAIYQAVPVVEALRAYADSLRGDHPYCGTPTAAVTLLSAGVAANVIPDRCEITLDRRLVPGESRDAVIREVEEVLAQVRELHPDVSVTIESFLPTTGGPSETPADHPVVAAAVAAARAAGGTGEIHGMSGACDMTHFRSVGIPTVVMGPGEDAQAHQPDEHIEVDELNRGAAAYVRAAIELCGVAT